MFVCAITEELSFQERGRGQRRQGGRGRNWDNDRNDGNDFDDDDSTEDVIDIFVDLILETGEDNEDNITVEEFEDALEDIMGDDGRLPPAIDDILNSGIFEKEGMNGAFSTSQVRQSKKKTMFFVRAGGSPRFRNRQKLWGQRPHHRKPRCSPHMKEIFEMKKVASLLFMQLMTKAPEDMKGFTFLPLSLRQSLKEATTTLMKTGPPKIFQPLYKVLANNTQLQQMVGQMYKGSRMYDGTAKFNIIFDFWRNNATKIARDELQNDPEMLELLDLTEQYLDMLKPYMQEMHNFVDQIKTMAIGDNAMMMAFMNGRPGAEPTEQERCMRLARMTAEAMQPSQMSIQATQATLFESPFDMVVADQTSGGGPQSPVYWRVEKQGVLRGERCPLTGTMMWAKVAVCSCKNSFPGPPMFAPPRPFPGFGMGPGGIGPDSMGPGG
ncbi:hypothetical protein FHG87_022473, partial [Trinorchestia longiramus]